MPSLVTFVQADVYRIGLRRGNTLDIGPDAFRIRDISCSGHFGAGGRSLGGIYRIDVEILVAAFILREKNEFAVA